MNKKQNTLELEIEELAYGGKGVARKDNFVWFVKGGLPGQKVKAGIRKKRKSYGEAVIDEVIEPSPDQIQAPCPYFGTCGGCQLQHLKYETQLLYKTRQTEEILCRVGRNSKKYHIVFHIKRMRLSHHEDKREVQRNGCIDNRWWWCG